MVWQWSVGVASFIILVWGTLPFFTGRICNTGVRVCAAVGMGGMLLSVFWDTVWQAVGCFWESGTAAKITVCAVVAVMAALVLLFVGISVLLIVSANRSGTAKAATVLVPGAKLYVDRLSKALQQRLDAAVIYLQAHPDMPCVVSGGQGADEPRSEAVAMRDYLVGKGIDGNRIYMEDRSTSTFENMQFSRKVIDQNGLPTAVVIVTQEFHQYRCGVYAKRAGLPPICSVTCKTGLQLLLCYWVREIAGVCRMWILGY